MAHGGPGTASIDRDIDRLQSLKGTLRDWATQSALYAQETRDPYSYMTYTHLRRALNGLATNVEMALGIVLEAKEAEMTEQLARLHREVCAQATVFGDPC